MDSMSDKVFFEQVAENIRSNIDDINNVLQNCDLNSNLVSDETQKNILDFLSLNESELIKNEAKLDYYELDQVDKILEMLDSSKFDFKKKGKMPRADSLVSLASSSSQSVEDLSVSKAIDQRNEIAAHLKEIETSLSGISNTQLRVVNLKSITDEETGKNMKFVDLVMRLQKTARELQSIASSDKTLAAQESCDLNGEIIENLQRVIQSLKDVEESNKNQIASIPKLENCSFTLTSIVNNVLENIEKSAL